MMLAFPFLLSTVAFPALITAKEGANQTVVIILLGPPGAGKGTQAGILKETLQVPHISTGDLLRANIKEGTSLGKKAQVFMDAGKLVPDDLILDMLFARVAEEDCQKGYILDGFPRTLNQAEAYHARLDNHTKTAVLNLELNDDIIVSRLSNRLVCSSCSTPYHLKHSPPKKEGVCSECQAALIQRTDDKEEVIRKRLAVYHEQTAPLIRYYAESDHLYTVSCNQSIDQILSEILDYLREVYRSI